MSAALALDPIRARTEAATLGPWTPDHGMFGTMITAGRTHFGTPLTVASVAERANAEFVAGSRDDVPLLIGEIEALREILTRTAEQLETYLTLADYDRGAGRGFRALVESGDEDALLVVEARAAAGVTE